MTRTAAFGRYGIRLRNVMSRWSGVSADGPTVAVSLWRHEFGGPAGEMVYDKADSSDWKHGIAKSEFFAHLQWAVDHCEGIVRVVIVVRDPSDPSRTIDCYPAPNVIMRVIALDAVGSTFRLEQVRPAAELMSAA
ncbi:MULTISPECIES: hypothetical protein [unclassified Bradyrhizobium]|uniref:hypothetical protein n=1 Tax=unclassified Bradyrhizobium TaxID=2631580 RepID=UPI001FF7E15F|nr:MULTISPECIES: hypothetical protein [unclassified Bradyrhizobium]MCK1297522.1 hypothetical protein [Bradyrhizobium sp. 37]MCK1770926.1 hypothetical protein [Bradyrhizobium sp. 134]